MQPSHSQSFSLLSIFCSCSFVVLFIFHVLNGAFYICSQTSHIGKAASTNLMTIASDCLLCARFKHYNQPIHISWLPLQLCHNVKGYILGKCIQRQKKKADGIIWFFFFLSTLVKQIRRLQQYLQNKTVLSFTMKAGIPDKMNQISMYPFELYYYRMPRQKVHWK